MHFIQPLIHLRQCIHERQCLPFASRPQFQPPPLRLLLLVPGALRRRGQRGRRRAHLGRRRRRLRVELLLVQSVAFCDEFTDFRQLSSTDDHEPVGVLGEVGEQGDNLSVQLIAAVVG